MSRLDLVPLDAETDGELGPISLPDGVMVFGRGSFLRVSDKRVSRNHGVLENLDGRLRIKPTHLNPCFCQSSLYDLPKALERNQWHTLEDGDIFSLLPGKYIYRVAAVGEENGTPRTSQSGDDEEAAAKFPTFSPEQNGNHAEGNKEPKETKELSSILHSNQTEPMTTLEKDKNKLDLKAESKKRILPSWMMSTVVATSNQSSMLKGTESMSGHSASTSGSTLKHARGPLTSSGNELELRNIEEKPRKKVRRNKWNEEQMSKTVLASKEEESDEPVNFGTEEAQEKTLVKQKAASTAPNNGNSMTSRGNVSESEDQKSPCRNKLTDRIVESHGSNGASNLTQPRAQRRTPCLYGKDCYRKNPLHFQESSHPGDSDYENEILEEENVNLPECTYGADCYRKNPVHWKEYKHTVQTVMRTRAALNNEEEEDDEDDDKFINDNSEDMDDDSDYVPPDSNDSDMEDIKRLQNEAKAFVKKRK